MSAYDFVGFLSGLTGLSLALVGLLLSVFAGIRVLAVLRKPAKGRIARGLAVAGLTLFLLGATLFLAAEFSPFRRGLDQAVGKLALFLLLLSLFAGVWAGRRRSAGKVPQPEEPPPQTSVPS